MTWNLHPAKALIAALLVLAHCSGETPLVSIQINGVVADASGKPVAGVTVVLGGCCYNGTSSCTYTTDSNGKWTGTTSARGNPSTTKTTGTCSFTASKSGYTMVTSTFTACTGPPECQNGQVVEADISFQ